MAVAVISGNSSRNNNIIVHTEYNQRASQPTKPNQPNKHHLSISSEAATTTTEEKTFNIPVAMFGISI